MPGTINAILISVTKTTIGVYTADRDWFQARQLKASYDRGVWIPMADLVHGLIMAVESAEVDGGS